MAYPHLHDNMVVVVVKKISDWKRGHRPTMSHSSVFFYVNNNSHDNMKEDDASKTRQTQKWKTKTKWKQKSPGRKNGVIHREDTKEDVRRVCGDGSWRRCRAAVNMIVSAPPGCSASRLNNAEDLMLLWTRLCREPPVVLCCVVNVWQTTGKLWSQFSGVYLQVTSEKGFIFPATMDGYLPGVDGSNGRGPRASAITALTIHTVLLPQGR